MNPGGLNETDYPVLGSPTYSKDPTVSIGDYKEETERGGTVPLNVPGWIQLYCLGPPGTQWCTSSLKRTRSLFGKYVIR